jgi:sugar fermentation stimulation protein A
VVKNEGSVFYRAARGDLKRGKFLSRPNRFIVTCVTDSGIVSAYLPNPGRLWELLLPGVPVLLEKAGEGPNRNTGYTVLAVETERGPVMLHTHRTNDVAERLFGEGLIPGWEKARVAKRETTCGRSRFDFLLELPEGSVPAEVKSCTLFGNTLAMFPDAPSERARRHILHLAEIGRTGPRPLVLFLVQSGNMKYFLPDFHTDFEFARALYEARNHVDIKAVGIEWSPCLEMKRAPCELDLPWHIFERHGIDGGAYLLLLKLDKSRSVSTGSLGEIEFPSGHYCYVGSARRNLKSRMARHLRRRKNFHWHIDYLREHCEVKVCIPVRSAEDLECSLASAVGDIAENSVHGFGSSDCSCGSHLFRFSSDPLKNRNFVKILIDFRINRLVAEKKPGQGA